MPVTGRHARLAISALMAGLVSYQAGSAQAATFTVSPTQVYLSAAVPSALVSLRNDSQETLRFELTMHAWDQKPNGEMVLTPTQDVVFFPRLLTLEAGEERKIRVGLAPGVSAGPTERAYRIFVQELPPPRTDAQPPGVRMLTRMGIPIFLQPVAPAPKPALDGLAAGAGRVRFTLKNSGNAHVMPEMIRVDGLAEGGRVAFSEVVNAWYVLAGGLREFDVEVPRSACEGTVAVAVTAKAGEVMLTQRLDTPSGPCHR